MSLVLNLLKEPPYFLYNLPSQVEPSPQNRTDPVNFFLAALPLRSGVPVRPLAFAGEIFALYSSPDNVSVYQALKSGAEFAGTCVHVKVGLFIHTALTLGENLNGLRLAKRNLALQIIRVASNALYLLSMCNIKRIEKYSSRIVLASMVVEACSNFVQAALKPKAQNRWDKDIDTGFLATGGIGCIRICQAFNQFELIQKTT